MGYGDPLQDAVGAGAAQTSQDVTRQAPIPLGPYSASGLIANGAGYLCGYTVVETSGSAPAACRLWDGQSTQGQRAAGISVLANDSKQVGPYEVGAYCARGLFLEVQSGAVSVVVYWRYAQ